MKGVEWAKRIDPMKSVVLWTDRGGVYAVGREERVILFNGIALVVGGIVSAAWVYLQSEQAELLRWAMLPLLGFSMAGILLVAGALLLRATVKARRLTAASEATVVEGEFAKAA